MSRRKLVEALSLACEQRMRGRESERRIEGNETLDNGWVHIAEVAVGAVVLLILLMLFLPFQP